jgi:hypothetical protein
MNALGSGSGRHAVAADVVFDGTTLHRDRAVLIADVAITPIPTRRTMTHTVPVRHIQDERQEEALELFRRAVETSICWPAGRASRW